MRGDIETPWAMRAKEYSWSLCANLAPRKITPSDIDYVAECNGKFAFFEMKTVGEPMKGGQEMMLNRLLSSLRGQSILFIVEHQPLDRVELPDGVVRFRCRMFPKTGEGRQTGLISGQHFPLVYSSFFDWADNRNTRALFEAFARSQQETPAEPVAAPTDSVEWIRDFDSGWEKYWRPLA